MNIGLKDARFKLEMNDVIVKEPALTERVELYDFSITEEMRWYSWSTQSDFSIS